MTYHRPGQYVDEALLAQTTPVNSTVAVAALVGAAKRGPVVPTHIASWTDALKQFGDFTGVAADDNLLQAIYNALSAGARDIYVNRAVHANAAAATLPFSLPAQGQTPGASALDFTAVNPGTWGNQIYVEVVANANDATRFNLLIREVPVGVNTITNSQIVERWSDLSLNPTDIRYVVSVLNSAVTPSNYVRAALHTGYTYTSGDVLAASSQAGGSKLTGGLDGGAVTSADLMNAVYALDVITQPFVLNLPGVTDTTTVTALADYADAGRTRGDNNEPGRGDVFVVVDTAPGEIADDAITQAKTYPASDYLAAYYPPVVVADVSTPQAAATKLVPVGPLVVGRYMATDAAKGVFKTPAGVTDGLLSQVVALDPAADLKNPQLDRLNDAGVNAVKLVPNRGFCIFGGRTLKSSFITRYVAPRRTIIGVRAALLDRTSFAPFENNDSYLWGLLYSEADKICRELYTAGGLKGATTDEAYFVKCDGDNNTPATIEQGEVHLEVGLALERPAEFVVIKISQFESGSTATDNTVNA